MATVGKTSAGSTTSTSSGNKTVVSPFTVSGTGPLTIGHLRAAVDTGSATANVVVYSDVSGAPGSRLAISDTIAITNTVSADLTAPFSGANIITLTDGQAIHVGASWPDPGSNSIIYERDNTASQRREQTSAAPNPFGSPSLTSGGPIAAYVEFTTAGAPGSVFDLSNLKITIPTDGGDGGTAADEITQPTLDTYSDANFYLDASNRMVMIAPVQGATTGGSGGTRTEGREMEGGVEADWDIATTAPRQLTVSAFYDPTSISDRQEMIVGQIHATGGTPPIYLTIDYEVASPRLRVFKDGPGVGNLLTGLTTATLVTYRIRIAGGRVKIWAVAGAAADLPSISSSTPFDYAAADFAESTHCYLKGPGAYNKSEVADGGTGQAVTKVTYFLLEQNITTGNVRDRRTGGGAAATSHVVTVPTGTKAGDRVVVGFVNDDAATTASTATSGWSSLGSQAQGTGTNHRLTIFTGVAASPTDSFTVSLSGSQESEWVAEAMIGDGGTPTTPQFANGGSATTGTVGAISGATSGDYTSMIFAALDNSVAQAHVFTPPSGYANTTTAGGATEVIVAAAMDQDLVTATGIAPGSVTWTNAEQWVTGHVLVPKGTETATGPAPRPPRGRRLAALLEM